MYVLTNGANMRQKFNISFSGGRTSGYMTKLLLDNWSDRYDFIVTFANTGLEHPQHRFPRLHAGFEIVPHEVLPEVSRHKPQESSHGVGDS